MKLENSILEDIREAVGLARDSRDFDVDLIMHTNIALSILNQNGIGNIISISDISQTWADLKDPLAIEGNKVFHMIPGYIKLSVKMMFDPPPPSAVDYYSQSINEILWRMKIAYEESISKREVIINDNDY